MKHMTKTGTITSAYGKDISPALTYDYSWDNYEGYNEVVAANDLPSNNDIVKYKNDAKQLAARNKAWTARLEAAGIEKPTAENDPQVALRDMFKTLIQVTVGGTKKYTEEQARAKAVEMVGIDWED